MRQIHIGLMKAVHGN